MTYPDAMVEMLPLDHSAPRGSKVDRIVLHITAGPTAHSAIETFRTSKAPQRTSAHFVIDRDGTVYQLVDTVYAAWHASQVNACSVGIEHAAIPEALPATQAQYEASAKLVAWLCHSLEIPCDRAHVLGHNEASPKDGHTRCCEGALSADKVVEMAAALREVPA
jgi:N-acetyl-anhydromuramyl-L-alanine amidase AmpD